MDEIRTTIERWKILARLFINAGTKAFIIDINNTWHWCNIIDEDENKIVFKNFKGNNIGKQQEKWWPEIVKFEEYREESL